MLFLHPYLICKTPTLCRLEFRTTHLCYWDFWKYSRNWMWYNKYMRLCCFLWQPGSCKVPWQGSSVPTQRRGAILETSDSRVLCSCVDLEIKKNKHNYCKNYFTAFEVSNKKWNISSKKSITARHPDLKSAILAYVNCIFMKKLPGIRWTEAPVHWPSMAKTWSSVKPQCSARLFQPPGFRSSYANRQAIERRCLVS